MICGWVGVVGWVSGSMSGVKSGQMTKNLICRDNGWVDLIKIIQFCLKICDL